ncbi:MAG: hypothetical protein AB7L71_13635 [Vicinamibacterales bacterium]
MRTPPVILVSTAVALLAACGGSPTSPTPSGTSSGTSSPTGTTRPVYVVVFTHIEDNTPAGSLGGAEARASYLAWREDLIAMAQLARRRGAPWVFQPDWKLLEAARLYENADVRASTGGRNLLEYLRRDLGAVIDPHSHEAGGYNYTDVAYLLDVLGVGGSTVIGGHVWDPSLPQFAAWDRYRSPVRGQRYPEATWRGDILMGAATPGHTNDPVVSGVWHPRNRASYFEDDPSGNMVAIGDFQRTIAGVSTLYDRAAAGAVESHCMLTSTYHIQPADIRTAAGLADVERTVIDPLLSLQAQGRVVLTDFTSLVDTWRSAYGGRGCTYRQ